VQYDVGHKHADYSMLREGAQLSGALMNKGTDGNRESQDLPDLPAFASIQAKLQIG
jgi:hypothetical protein